MSESWSHNSIPQSQKGKRETPNFPLGQFYKVKKANVKPRTSGYRKQVFPNRQVSKKTTKTQTFHMWHTDFSIRKNLRYNICPQMPPQPPQVPPQKTCQTRRMNDGCQLGSPHSRQSGARARRRHHKVRKRKPDPGERRCFPSMSITEGSTIVAP